MCCSSIRAARTSFRYIGLVADDSIAEALREALDDAQPEAKHALMALAEKWTAEGEAKGRAEGEVKGRVKAKVDILHRLLTLKFGALTEATAQRIASASEAELDRWIERLLAAATLNAVIDG